MDRGRPQREYTDRRAAAPRSTGRQARPNPAGGRAYDGRFGSSADAGRKRPTGSYRNQPSGSYRSRMDYDHSAAHRPSMREGGDSYTRRPAPAPAPAPKKKTRRKVNVPILLLGILIVLVLAALIAVVVSSAGQTFHQLPTVERLASSEGA